VVADKEPDLELLTELATGAEKVFANAEALYREAVILRKAGALNRALFLYQISFEECAKADLIGAWATSHLMGYAVDPKMMAVVFASHAKKNCTNAYLMGADESEKDARERGDMDAALLVFKKRQADFHLEVNAAKNAALYVDFKDGKFAAPDERITADMVAEFAARNETFLAHARLHVRTVQRMLKEPNEARESALDFMKMADELKAENPANLFEALESLVTDWLESGIAKRNA
jgi:AbiV family abortive infection protein